MIRNKEYLSEVRNKFVLRVSNLDNIKDLNCALKYVSQLVDVILLSLVKHVCDNYKNTFINKNSITKIISEADNGDIHSLFTKSMESESSMDAKISTLTGIEELLYTGDLSMNRELVPKEDYIKEYIIKHFSRKNLILKENATNYLTVSIISMISYLGESVSNETDYTNTIEIMEKIVKSSLKKKKKKKRNKRKQTK